VAITNSGFRNTCARFTTEFPKKTRVLAAGRREKQGNGLRIKLPQMKPWTTGNPDERGAGSRSAEQEKKYDVRRGTPKGWIPMESVSFNYPPRRAKRLSSREVGHRTPAVDTPGWGGGDKTRQQVGKKRRLVGKVLVYKRRKAKGETCAKKPESKPGG